MALEKYLKKHGITQKQFAAKLGCSQGLVSQWITGETKITNDWALKIERETKRSTPHDYVKRQALLPELYRGMAA